MFFPRGVTDVVIIYISTSALLEFLPASFRLDSMENEPPPHRCAKDKNERRGRDIDVHAICIIHIYVYIQGVQTGWDQVCTTFVAANLALSSDWSDSKVHAFLAGILGSGI